VKKLQLKKSVTAFLQ